MLVTPCETPALSLKWTKMRDVPGAKGICPVVLTKIEKVGAAFGMKAAGSLSLAAL
jgi:hypothetical protein